MKKAISLLVLVCVCVWANECDTKIEQLKGELQYAKEYKNESKIKDLENAIHTLSLKCKENSSYYDELVKTKQEKARHIQQLQKSLDELDRLKDTMSKADYKTQKERLKAQKDSAGIKSFGIVLNFSIDSIRPRSSAG